MEQPPLREELVAIPEAATQSPVPKHTIARSVWSDAKWGAIPPAELEIIRMKRESQSMFTKKKMAPSTAALGDLPVFAPTDRLEDEVVKTQDPGAVEAWVNAHLLRGAIQLIPLSDAYVDASDDHKRQALLYQSKLEYNDIQTIFASPDKSPLEGAGIDSGSLLRLGLPRAIVDRIFRGLFVYSSGFHTLIHEIGRHCPPYAEAHIAANIWLTFLHLLEKCEDGRYEMAMLKFNHATAVWKQNAIQEYERQEQALKDALVAAQAETVQERAVVAERVADVEACEATIAALRDDVVAAKEATAAAEDLGRLANLEILELENTLAATRKELGAATQALHVALSEQANLQVEIAGYASELQHAMDVQTKADEHKARAADRMRELQAAGQAVRDELELVRTQLKATGMDKAKLFAEHSLLALRNKTLEAKVEMQAQQLVTLAAALSAKASAVEEADATLLSLKQAMDRDRVAFVAQTAEVAALQSVVSQQKRDHMVLEAQAQLLLMEKKNNNMREGDRLRIERLLNKKVELEKEVDALRAEKEKSHEHLWTLRATLEAVENDLHMSKRAFATSQTSLQQLDKVNDQLRGQMAEMERNVDRMTIGFNAMKDRCKAVEDGAKEQVDKVEVELKVAMAQMREMAYMRRENESQISDLAKTIETNAMEIKVLHQRLEQSDKVIHSMTVERDALLREKRVIQLEYNANQLVMTKLHESTSHLMGRIRKHEVSFDEAIAELKGHYEDAFALGSGHLEPGLTADAAAALPSKTAADVMHKSVAAVMELMNMKDEHPAFQQIKRRRSLTGKELKAQCEYRIVELGQDIARREAERVQLLRDIDARDGRLRAEQARTAAAVAVGCMHAERSVMVLEDFAARLLRFRAYEQSTTRKIMDQEFELYRCKNRIKELLATVAQLQLLLDQSGMAEEDASGYLTIEKVRFQTRVDESVQAVVATADDDSQTYPPRRSPIKERAKLHHVDFSAPESVLTNITELIPDEELDHHFYSLTHHSETLEFAHGHLLRRSGGSPGGVLPKLSQATLDRHAKPAKRVRTNVVADLETQFGLHARIAMPRVGPFVVSRPVQQPEDNPPSRGRLALLAQDITDHDYDTPGLQAPSQVRHLQPSPPPKKGRATGPPTATSPAPPRDRSPKAHTVRRARPTRHDTTHVVGSPGSIEHDAGVLDTLRAPQPVYRHLAHGPPFAVDSDSDDELERVEDYFTTTPEGMLVEKPGVPEAVHVPTLLEQRVKEHRAAQQPGPRSGGWDLRGNNSPSGDSPLPPVLYPLTKS
ncbi:hypothetical protein ACHHYP_00412 [Achlya hypogyna]|uniref:Uncharacterized protein n=1 Tax=Achlya hypogyna TaxID=1202772 RepID=A0A1V9ZUN8_ACHHY|nr:hypothetical protein ACHHYP_00412 [Achlya hypogyna]